MSLKLSLDLVYSHLRRFVAVVAYLRGVSQGIHSESLKLKLTQTCVTHIFVTGSCITEGMANCTLKTVVFVGGGQNKQQNGLQKEERGF